MKNYEIITIKEGTPHQGLSEARQGREFCGYFFDLQNPLLAFIKNAWIPQKVDLKKPSVNEKIAKGGKGVLPLGCLPLWGREGVTLTTNIKQKARNRDILNFHATGFVKKKDVCL
jgi:hypothetical protein